MKIQLPSIPYELLDTLSSAEVPLVQAYARQAIREFIASQGVVAYFGFEPICQTCQLFMAGDAPKKGWDGGDSGWKLAPLIIKPELDDADR